MKGNCERMRASQIEKPWPEGWKMEKRFKRIENRRCKVMDRIPVKETKLLFLLLCFLHH